MNGNKTVSGIGQLTDKQIKLINDKYLPVLNESCGYSHLRYGRTGAKFIVFEILKKLGLNDIAYIFEQTLSDEL